MVFVSVAAEAAVRSFLLCEFYMSIRPVLDKDHSYNSLYSGLTHLSV